MIQASDVRVIKLYICWSLTTGRQRGILVRAQWQRGVEGIAPPVTAYQFTLNIYVVPKICIQLA